MTLQDMFRTIWFGKWLVLVSVLAALGGAYLYVSRQEPQYASTATVQIVDAETLAASGVRLESDPSLVTSDSVTAAAAEELGDPRLADGLAGSSTAQYATDSPSNVIITETGPDPDATVDRANAIATAYVAALQAQFDDDLEAMQERLSNLASSIDQQQKAITDARRAAAAATTTTNPNAQVDPVDGLLEAQYSTTMDQYQTLSGQLTQAQLLASPASILQNAVGSALVSLPGSLVYLIAGLAGLLVGIGLAVVRRGLDTKVRTSGQARRSAGAPVLARLSGTGAALKSAEAEGTLPVARREATAYTRSIRELRTALQAAVENESGSAVIVVTAADVETPRSFLAANLAASWALSGRSVVVLSGDLRQPRLNALLPADADAPVRTGRGGGRARTAAVPTAIPHLAVHPALQTELDPADFLASADVRALVEQLRATADVVIIDAPPMLVAADATILGSYADGVLLAVTLGHTHVGAVEESAERLRAANAALLGLSVDGTTERSEATYAATYAFAGAEDVPGEPQDTEEDRPEGAGAAEDRAADAPGADAPVADAPAGTEATDTADAPDAVAAPADDDAAAAEAAAADARAADGPADAETEVPAPRPDGQHRADRPADRPAGPDAAAPADEPADAARSGEDRAAVAAESK